jgi:iron complex transport system substrate-binding protein
VQPDLIIAWDRHREMREAMEKIAPVIEISYPKPYNETHYIREMGKLLGKEEDAEKLIVEREAKIAEARKQLASTNETAVFLAADVGGIYGVDGLESTRFYSSEGEGLGLKAPDQLPAVWSEISLEGLAEMNPDHLFINMFPANEEDYNLMLSELSKSAVWNSLPAVQNKQVYPIEESTYRGGVLGMYLLSDQAVETLLK